MSGKPTPRQALVRLSLSATDGEWAAVHGKAVRRGLSISRYLVGVALADLPAGKARPAPALDGTDERRLLEAIRGLEPLLSEPDGPDAPEMPEWVAALLQAWLSALARSGRAGELRAFLAKEDAERIAAALSPEAQTGMSKSPAGAGARAKAGPEPGQQRALL